MRLLDIFKRERSGATPATAVASGEQAAQSRTRARQRLVGAVVLLGIGVVAFPLLFESQPRPIPVDIPIEIPSRNNAVPLALPAPRAPVPKPAASLPAAVTAPQEAPREPAAPASAPVVAAPVAKAVEPTPIPPASKPVVAANATPAPPKSVTEPVKPAAESAGRFVVQVGAFAEAGAVRDARAKVEKLGLPTYTQAVETAGGKRTRVRLGPYATREEAEQAAAKVKASGLPGAVLAL